LVVKGKKEFFQTPSEGGWGKPNSGKKKRGGGEIVEGKKKNYAWGVRSIQFRQPRGKRGGKEAFCGKEKDPNARKPLKYPRCSFHDKKPLKIWHGKGWEGENLQQEHLKTNDGGGGGKDHLSDLRRKPTRFGLLMKE